MEESRKDRGFRYLRRYRKLKNLLEKSEKGSIAVILPLAIGVGAWVPRFTKENLQTAKGNRRTKDIVKELILIARSSAVEAYYAWRAEG